MEFTRRRGGKEEEEEECGPCAICQQPVSLPTCRTCKACQTAAWQAWKEVAPRIHDGEDDLFEGDLVYVVQAEGDGEPIPGQITLVHKKGEHAGTYRVDCPPAEQCRVVTEADMGSPAFQLVDEATEDTPFRKGKSGLLSAFREDLGTATVAARESGPVLCALGSTRIPPDVHDHVERTRLVLIPFKIPDEYDWVAERAGLAGDTLELKALKERLAAIEAAQASEDDDWL